MRLTFVTVVTGDFLPQAAVLLRSVKLSHPDSYCCVVVVDWSDHFDPPASPYFDLVIPHHALGCDRFPDMAYRYTIPEFCFALKPWALRYILEEIGHDNAVYLDSDIKLFSPLSEVMQAFEDDVPLILTPHVTTPASVGVRDTDLKLLQSGIFNAGFMAVCANDQAMSFLSWLCSRSLRDFTHDAVRGTYGDQAWLNFAPAFVQRMLVLRHDGYNVAYWNAYQRAIHMIDSEYFAGREPLRFIHFSHLRRSSSSCEEDSLIYLREYMRGATINYKDILISYLSELDEFASSLVIYGSPPSFGSAIVREAYSRLTHGVTGSRSDVWQHAVRELNKPAARWGGDSNLYMTSLYDYIWEKRPDIAANKFDVAVPDGKIRFASWICDVGRTEYSLPEELVAPARRMLSLVRG